MIRTFTCQRCGQRFQAEITKKTAVLPTRCQHPYEDAAAKAEGAKNWGELAHQQKMIGLALGRCQERWRAGHRPPPTQETLPLEQT